MFVIDEEPELGICQAGDVGEMFPAFNKTDINADFINLNTEVILFCKDIPDLHSFAMSMTSMWLI